MGKEFTAEKIQLCQSCLQEGHTVCQFKLQLEELKRHYPRQINVFDWHQKKTNLRKEAQLRACPFENYDPRVKGEDKL